jgi:hypothetical protein
MKDLGISNHSFLQTFHPMNPIDSAKAAVAQADALLITAGAGTAIPSIRWMSGNAAEKHNSHLIRINPREAQVQSGQFSIPTGALEGLSLLFPNPGS